MAPTSMKKSLPFILFFACSFFGAQAQENNLRILLRSTTASVGTSSQVNRYIVQQSIGQSSPTGTFTVGNYEVRQGFIQSDVWTKIADPTTSLLLNTTVYPNPFIDQVHVSFIESITSSIQIEVFTVLGKKMSSETYPIAQKIILDLSRLVSGGYFLRVAANSKQFTGRLIKY